MGVLKIEQIAPIDRHWAIHEQFAEQYLWALEGLSASGSKVEVPNVTYENIHGVAVLELTGPMTKRPTSVQHLFGGTSTMLLRSALRDAAKDPDISSILLVIDSPGGQAQGTADLADEIVAARAKKPVVAYVNGLAASAAYWAASACDRVYASRMSEVGCIGTYMVLRDTSEKAAAAGVKVLVIRDGEFKGAGTAGTEITAEQQAEFKREVSALNSHFVADVARHRHLTPTAAKGLADGRIHVGQAAVELGLIDGVCSLEQCLDLISSGVGPGPDSAGKNGFLIGGTMAETVKPGFLARLAGWFKTEGIYVEPAAPTQDDSAGKVFIESACAHLEPARRSELLPLAVAALAADGGVPGSHCASFRQLMAVEKPPIDMKTPVIAQLVNQLPDEAKKKAASEAERVLATAVQRCN